MKKEKRDLLLSLVIFSAFFQAKPAFAIFGFGGAKSQQDFSCLGIDGVPITGGALEAECCSNNQLVANPGPDCLAGFYSISTDATTDVANNVQLAQNALTAAGAMTGATTDWNNVTASNTAPATGGSLVETSAATAGGATSVIGSSTTDPSIGSTGGTSGSGDSGSGSGSGSGGAAGGLDTSLSSSPGSAAGANPASAADANAAINAAADAANRGVAVAYNANTNGAGGKIGNGFAGFNFGSGDSAKDKNIMNENISFDDKAKNDQAGNKALDEDAGATEIDPEDYFKKIDQSANLFKIVSNRYFKKKSLWKVK
jgi:hypothetical protein